MSNQSLSQVQLLACSDADFDKNIKNLAAKDLMGLISYLQKEMAGEQEHFNGLSSALNALTDRKSRQYKSISADMVKAQARLTTLMNRSMKCFSQQTLQQNSQDVQLRRLNSSRVTTTPGSDSSPRNSSSPVKSATVQRSRSLHTINQLSATKDDPTHTTTPNTPKPQNSNNSNTSTSSSPAPSGVQRGSVVRTHSGRLAGQSRPASVVGLISSNGGGGGSQGKSVTSSSSSSVVESSDRVSSGYAQGNASSSSSSRVSLGYVPGSSSSSSSLSTLNFVPQTPVIIGSEQQRRPRSKSQIVLTPTPAFMPLSSSPAAVPPSHSQSHSHAFPPAMLTHASSQPSLASPSPSPSPRAELSLSLSSPPEKGYGGLPSVKQLAQSFGARTPDRGAQERSSSPSATYRPVIRAQSVAGSDASRRPGLSMLTSPASASSSAKVNGVPSITAGGGGGGGGSGGGGQQQQQRTYIKRNAAPKPPLTPTHTQPAGNNNNNNGMSELEKIHARLQSSREFNLTTLPDKPLAKREVNGSSSVPNGDREISVFSFKTNLDRKKSSSSIALGQKDFDDGGGALSLAKPAKEAQMAPLRRAQSREELYAIESRARAQKESLMKEIGGRKKSEEEAKEKEEDIPTVRQWGLKGTSLLAQRLHQDDKDRTDQPSSNGETRPSSSSSSTTTTTTSSTLSSVQLQPAKGKQNGRGAGDGRLTMSSAAQKVTSKPATDRKSLPPQPSSLLSSSSSSSSSSQQPSGKQQEIATNTVLKKTTTTTTASTAATASTALAGVDGYVDDDDDDVIDEGKPRMNLINWDPKPVLDHLYSIKLMDETAEDISHQFVHMEGLMEKLPMNKKKSTLLKTWKRRFFRAKDGWLQYFETGSRDKPSESLQLMGGHIDDMGNRILGIDDGRGHYLMVRAPTDKEHGQWKVALESQTADNTKATYVRPQLSSPPHSSKKVVVIDLGSSAIRAGVLGENECLPQVFFPSVVAVDKDTGRKVVGMEAYHPDVRRNSTLLHPIRPSNRVDKEGVMKKFNIDVDMMTAVFGKVFSELGVNPSQYMVMLSTPQILSDSLRAGLMEALVGALGVLGVCMVQQSLLALYSYRATTGIIVDIGHRLEILPIYDGFVIEGGVSRCPYGSQKVLDSLKKALLETNYKFASEVELLLVQYIMQQSCYVAYNYKEEERLCDTQPDKLTRTVNLDRLNLPEGTYKSVDVLEGRFSSPEGFFNVDLWEMDYPTLHKLIFQAIQSCPMDSRRHMYRTVYLSGGVTMLPGFQERLELELRKLAPPAVTVEVHASPNRYHAAYLGACSVAAMAQFRDMAISRDEWARDGVKAFRKWQTPAS